MEEEQIEISQSEVEELLAPLGDKRNSMPRDVQIAVALIYKSQKQKIAQETLRADREAQRADEMAQRADEEAQRADEEAKRADEEKKGKLEAILAMRKSAAIVMSLTSISKSEAQILQTFFDRLIITSIQNMLGISEDGTDYNDLWRKWHEKGYSVPSVGETEKPAYHEYMAALVKYILDCFQTFKEPTMQWKIFREKGILFTGRYFAKFPDLLLTVSRNIHPSIGGENILMEFKRSLAVKDSKEDNDLRRTAVAEALDYAANNLREAIEMTPAEECERDFFTFGVAANATHINIIKVTLKQNPLPEDFVPTTSASESLVECVFEATDWLPLVPRDCTGEDSPTDGFKALCMLLNADEDKVMKLNTSPSGVQEITDKVKELRGAAMQYVGLLGRGGFSDALRYSNNQGDYIVAKVIRASDRPQRALLPREIKTLLRLKKEECQGVPVVVYPTTVETCDNPRYFLSQDCGVPLLAFLRQQMPQALIDHIQTVMNMPVEGGEAAYSVIVHNVSNTAVGSSSSAAAAASSSTESEQVTQQQPKRIRQVEFSHQDIATITGCEAYYDLILDIMQKVTDIVHEVHRKTGYVHMDIRPANIVVFPNQSNSGIERVMLIDWGSAEIIGKNVTSFIGSPAYQANALVATITNYTRTIAKMELIRLLNYNGSVCISDAFDIEAIQYTRSVLLHGGNCFVPPWDHCQINHLAAQRSHWYDTHRTQLPHCRCLPARTHK